MEITPEQYARIEPHLPTQRGNVSHENLNVINAILFIAENGCKLRALPKRFGNWHTIYMRMNRWAKAGVLDRLFAELQREPLIRIKIEAVSLDSTIIKVHPDGTGAPGSLARYLDWGRISHCVRSVVCVSSSIGVSFANPT